MSNLLYFIVFISFLTFSEPSWGQFDYSDIVPAPVDTVVYHPGFFNWDVNTVIKIRNGQAIDITRYQAILDHSNTDFSEQPQSLILIDVDPVKMDNLEGADKLSYSIAISQDTIHLTARSETGMETALARLRRIKMNARKDSPDYGLIYLRCGLYRVENF